MSVLTAKYIEPFMRKDKLCMLTVHPGSITEVDLSRVYDPKEYTNKEREAIEMRMTYRWPLPRDLFQEGGTPGMLRSELRTLKEITASIIRYLRRYVWLRKDSTYELLAMWIISTYFRDRFRFSPIIIADGITETGKSTLAKCLELVTYHAESWISCSAAAIAREIEDYDATIIMDEAIDALTSERGGEIFTMIRSCFERGQRWIRADPRGRTNYVYNVYSSMALLIRGVGLPEDVYNRGIRINMTPAPAHIEFGDLDNWHDDGYHDRSNPDDIRRDLYLLKLWSAAYPDDQCSVNFEKEIALTRKYLTTKLEDGRWYYANLYDFPPESPAIRGRDRNIASTLLSIAQVTGCERGIIQEILDNKESNREVYMDTPEAMAFVSLMELVEENFNRMAGLNPLLNYSTFAAAVAEISTTDIANRFNLILQEQGNASRDPVATKSVTAKINALGFKYERGEQNKSYMIPSPDFASLFFNNVKKYARSKTKIFRDIIKTEKIS